MKKIYVIVGLLAFSNVLMAQNSGEIMYKESTKIELKIDGMSEEMAAMIPKERSVLSKLVFNNKTALIKSIKEPLKNNNIEHQSEGARMVIKTDEPDQKTFYDLENMKCVDQKEFMSKKFLIESDLKNLNWKITGEQKEILGYACLEAILTNPENKDNVVKAWFCPTLPYSIGPMALGNLPGLILEVDINNGQSKIIAQKISLKEIDAKEIYKPSEGKKVSKKEFNEIVEIKRKEMEEQYGGEGNVIIKIRN